MLNNINSYTVTISTNKGKIFIDEEVDATDSKVKRDFLLEVAKSGALDEIFSIIEEFNGE